MALATADSAAPVSLGAHHQRLFALLIDYLLVVVAVNLASQALLGAQWDLRLPEDRTAGGWMHWLLWGGGLLLTKDAWFGRSPGKWFTGITVRQVDNPHQPPSRGSLILRNLPLVLLPVEAVLVFTDRYYRRLGDHWAGTVILTPKAVPHLGRRTLVFTSLLLGVLLLGFLIAPWNMRRSAAYQEAVRQVQTDPSILSQVGMDIKVSESGGFDLQLEPHGGRATLEFTATGERGQVAGRVALTLPPSAGQWTLHALTLEDPLQLEVQPATAPSQDGQPQEGLPAEGPPAAPNAAEAQPRNNRPQNNTGSPD